MARPSFIYATPLSFSFPFLERLEPGGALTLEARCRVAWDSVPVSFSQQVLHTWF